MFSRAKGVREGEQMLPLYLHCWLFAHLHTHVSVSLLLEVGKGSNSA